MIKILKMVCYKYIRKTIKAKARGEKTTTSNWSEIITTAD